MKTRDQRRQRRPLGSVFVGQAPQKRSLVYLLPILQAFSANGATIWGKKQAAAPARLRFCGAWPTKTEPSGRRWRR